MENLHTKQSYKGEWFLPGSPDKKCFGELKYDETGITLSVHGLLSGEFLLYSTETHDVIFGIIEGSIKVTLCNVFLMQRGNVTFAVDTDTYTPDNIYRVNYCLVGEHYINGIKHPFKSIRAQIPNLDEWVCHTGWKLPELPFGRKKQIKLQYKLQRNIDFYIQSEQLKGAFRFSINSPAIPITGIKEVRMRQTTSLLLKSRKGRTVTDWLRQVLKFQSFLVLAIGRCTNIEKFLLIDSKTKKEIFLLYNQTNSNSIKIYSPLDMLFTYSNVKDDFSTYINKWYELWGKLDDMIWLLIEQFYHSSRASSVDFLHLAQLAESLHLKLYNHPREPKAEYRKKSKEIVSSVPEQYKEFIQGILSHSNSLTLSERLAELIDKCPQELLNTFVTDKDEFLKQVRDTRNFYTHYDPSHKTKIATGTDLYELSKQLHIVLMCIVYKELDLPSRCIDNLKNMVHII